jgi:penicillin-binding protein 1A
MGVTSHLDAIPAEAIGGLRIGVTPLEMADAYATLANGGSHVQATIINKVVFPDGSVDNLGDTPPKRVFPDGEAYAATQVLKQVITSGTGTAAGYGCPAAGKTGTANNLENAWFVGYTPRMSTAVWVGYAQGNIPMADGFGGALAAPIWHDYMQEASGGYCGNFPQPTNPFQGTAFFGKYSVTGGSGVGTNTGTTGSGTSSQTATTGSGGISPTSPTTSTSATTPAQAPPSPGTPGAGRGTGPPSGGQGNSPVSNTGGAGVKQH